MIPKCRWCEFRADPDAIYQDGKLISVWQQIADHCVEEHPEQWDELAAQCSDDIVSFALEEDAE